MRRCRTLLEDFTSWHSLIPNLLFSRGSLLPTISYHPVRMYAEHVRNSCDNGVYASYNGKSRFPLNTPLLRDEQGFQKKERVPRSGVRTGRKRKRDFAWRALCVRPTYIYRVSQIYYFLISGDFYLIKNKDIQRL